MKFRHRNDEPQQIDLISALRARTEERAAILQELEEMWTRRPEFIDQDKWLQ